MSSSHSLPGSQNLELRARLVKLIEGIDPWDDLERAHLRTAGEWPAGGAPVYRIRHLTL